MSSIQAGRRRLQVAIKDRLREMSIQLSLLNHQVGTRLDLKDIDLECLDVIGRHGPLNPSALARHAGLHPATMTGILDRLERAGWIARDRDPADRRGVLIRALRERSAEIYRLFEGMNKSMDDICADYTDAEIRVIADFLKRTTEAGYRAANDLSAGRL
jgi:DNA-binding MarR family transcriptional regulator